jgi:hypothetical protein
MGVSYVVDREWSLPFLILARPYHKPELYHFAKLSARHLLFPLFGQRLRDLDSQGAKTELVRYDLRGQ